ncbi:hypothetical protein [Epilithonimonas arachidiradicis]|uniref:Uncharacterized protein n=1 Tax=Epilithonimonas arachidiradicis TaxID=1617282 RepID=A0A420DA98_9FLAO|nr:hypothetical protein [Epilithonimonas arachidiradicis]RKE88208.1 hypothetical protein BXY58_1351 [Epilithonimonas arachidiradicis]GGG50518.1 hypothetical protein GCM10007332_10230 [Epilithonimonas arachidiradicis]
MDKKMLALSIFLFGFLGTLNLVKAQTTDNKIQEVFINSGDGFGELRKLLKDNFDFTNQDYKEGVVNSDVRFSLSEEGKITNVHANGDCKNVSKEIENVLSHLIYKVDMDKLSQKMLASSYVMPVSVTIDNR